MKHEIHFTEYLGEVNTNEIWPVYVALQKKIFYWNMLWKMWFQALSDSQIILFKNESEEVCADLDTFW